MSELSKPAWSGFWRRVGAFVVDSIVLGLAGLGIGMLFHDALSATAAPGRLIGLAVSVAYFGILSSGLGGSRTLGMRLLGLKVMATGGQSLGLPGSLWRALVLTGPMMINGMPFYIANELAMMVIGVVAAVLVFGVLLAQVVLLLFNLPSRRLVHDLVSGSAVVRTSATDIPSDVSRIAVGSAIGVVGLVLVASVGAALYGKALMPSWIAELEAPRAAVAALPEVMEVGVLNNTTTFYGTGGNQSTKSLVISARVRAMPAEPEALVQRIGDAVVRTYRLQPGQKVQVSLRHGFDIGIASGWSSYGAEYHPAAAPPAPAQPKPEA